MKNLTSFKNSFSMKMKNTLCKSSYQNHLPINVSLKSNLIILIIFFSSCYLCGQTNNYILRDSNFPTQVNDGGDFFNSGTDQLGMWANSGNKKTVAWRTFKTNGDNSGTNRTLQIGDVLVITVSTTRVYGQIGFSLNSGGVQGTNYENRINGSRLSINSNNYAAWTINRNGGTSSLNYVPIQSIYKDYRFTIKITSSITADVYLTVDGTDYRAYNIFLNGTGNIDAFSIYGSDMWDGDSNDDAFWKPTASVTNSGSVELGYFLTSGNYLPGLISNGLTSNSTINASINNVNIGGDAGSAVILNQLNTFSGTTTINANATLKLGISSLSNLSGPLGTSTNGTSISNGGCLDLNGFSLTSLAMENLTINGQGINNAGALINSNLTESNWDGPINLASLSTIGGIGNIKINGLVTGTNGLNKFGTNLVTLSNNQNNFSGV